MPTVEEVSRHVAGIVGIDNDLLLVGDWVARRWQEVANSTTLRALRRTGELVIPAIYSTGTVAVTQGSVDVTGTSTAFTQGMVGRHFRVRTNWYEIAAVVSATALKLKSTYTEDTDSSASFKIVQRRLTLASDVRKMGTFVHMRLRRPLGVSSQMGLDMWLSDRNETGSIPMFVSEVEPDTSGTRRVEIYPYSTTPELIHYMYWAEPPLLGFKDYIPGDIDTEALREGVLIDVYRHLQNKAAQANEIEKAAFYRNEMRTQETAWRNVHKKRLFQQDEGLDDLEFILMSQPAHPRSSRGGNRIVTAYDHIWHR